MELLVAFLHFLDLRALSMQSGCPVLWPQSKETAVGIGFFKSNLLSHPPVTKNKEETSEGGGVGPSSSIEGRLCPAAGLGIGALGTLSG